MFFYEHWQSIVNVGSPFFGALCGIYIWVPVTYYMYPHLLGIYLEGSIIMSIMATALVGYTSAQGAGYLIGSVLLVKAIYEITWAGAAQLSDGCIILLIIGAIIGTVPITGVTNVHAVILLIVTCGAI